MKLKDNGILCCAFTQELTANLLDFVKFHTVNCLLPSHTEAKQRSIGVSLPFYEKGWLVGPFREGN